jgi:FKBP-type peptidyl-prolyl cis-trans isomerase SlyD
MKVGDSKSVTVKPADGYGEVDADAFMDIPRDEFPSDIPLEMGLELEVRDEDGEILPATVVEITPEKVRLDFNHPLAGETLQFDITVVELRAATAEELEHGHVHGEDFDEDFDEEYEDDFVEYIEEDDEEE